MMDLLTRVTPAVDKTIDLLSKKPFQPDPIAGTHFSKIVSVMSSAYKRHGRIIEIAMLSKLKEFPEFEVWEDARFRVSQQADLVVGSSITKPLALLGTQLNYEPDGHRIIQVDLVVYNRVDKSLRAYEVKRGFGVHDAGKKRQILRDTLCVQVLLKDYGQKRNLEVATVSSHVIFYYGKVTISRPFGLRGDELDTHFGVPVQEDIERVNQLFRTRLFGILSHA